MWQDEYQPGDLVRLRAPHTEIEKENFKSGWRDDQMSKWEGKTAAILEKGFQQDRYMVCLPEMYDKVRRFHDYWWWDKDYIEPLLDMEEVSEKEYADILFEG